ncbi:DNA polymerase III subunit gamma/tau [Hydrogenophilus thiooxidans]|uniref:DNA polymerase III subunit gamma/tau n=1 Tax=Hydrogenophilus thiooxidans TaxID=2820326 RepID=UPI001C22646A|nr:DNA polymerase III subunit gamma/tau [Hydrogenophilus thiooxidans]
MTQLALARKWRPRDFSALVGQDHVVRALTHALTTGRLHHAYLFTGTRGVGKTTISRILAKALNCERGVGAEPCNACAACEAIDADRYPDYVEMDAASNRGVDEMAALLEQATYAPVTGRYKVYMIDEVHMLTGHAFNAMLKTLEEPPEHVKFVLATTDPQKIPVTVLSRCLQFNLRALSAAQIASRAATILTAEAIPFEPAALQRIGQAARGSMRDALSLLDQAIAYGAGTVSEAAVSEMLGLVSETVLIELLAALAAHANDRYLTLVAQLAEASVAVDTVLATLAQLIHRVARRQFGGAPLEDARLEALAHEWDPEFVQLAYQIVVHGRRDLPLAPDERTGLEMALLRLFAFAPQSQPTAQPVRTGPAPEPVASQPLSPPAPPARVAAPAVARPDEERIEPPKPFRPAPPPQKTAPRQHDAAEPAAESSAANRAWLDLYPRLELDGLAQTLASHCAVVADDGTTWTMAVDAPAHHWLKAKPELTQRVANAVAAAAPSQWQRRLRFEAAADVARTPAKEEAAHWAERKRRILEQASQHPGVQVLCERLGLEIDPDAVQWPERFVEG